VKGKFTWGFFDLDGTLIDHFAAIHQSYRYAQQQMGFAEASFAKVKRTVGGSVPVTMRQLVGPEVPQERVNEAIELFDRRFREIMFDEVEILPGVPELLERLQNHRVRLAVFTNKLGGHARTILEHLDLTRFFDDIVGAGDTPFRKPQPEFTDHVLKTTGAHPKETLLVGDSPFDVEAGKIRDLRVAGVATGSHTREQLAETEADWVFTDFNEIRDRLRLERSGKFSILPVAAGR